MLMIKAARHNVTSTTVFDVTRRSATTLAGTAAWAIFGSWGSWAVLDTLNPVLEKVNQIVVMIKVTGYDHVMRSYGQYCALAKALDVVGDRWTLLIVRELGLRGPCR